MGIAIFDRTMRRVIPRPRDRCRPWRGIQVPEAAETFRILRYGDCAWRETDRGHGYGTRPGYPLVLAERLAERGIATQFSDVYLRGAADLPATEDDLKRFVKLDGAPDVVILQMTSSHAVRMLVDSVSSWYNDLRVNAGQESGVLARPFYPLLHRALRRFGRVALPFPGTDPFAAFFDAVRATWPDATPIMLSPLDRAFVDGFIDPAEQIRVWREIAARCRRNSVPVVDSRDAIEALRATIGVRAVNGYNGYDLRRPGHEAVADLLMPHIEHRLAARRERAVPTAYVDQTHVATSRPTDPTPA